MRHQHIQMSALHRQIGRLDDRAAGVMDIWAQIGQFYEVLEILECAAPPPAFKIKHKGRPVYRRKGDRRSPDLQGPFRVAADLGEF